MSNNSKSNNSNSSNDSLAELLSLPVNFTVEPLLATPVATPTLSPTMAQKRPASLEKDETVSPRNQKTKERILRNRAAAQESRDKKRRYVFDLESNNKKLTEENQKLTDRVKSLEDQNAVISSQLEAFTRQLATLQAQIKFNAVHPILFNDFCDSARIAKKECLEVC
ncbi:uncharacterized protein B0P05DRAFT_548044 [Gilbertella persicaria]|uniref:uncharacterized protein n=1 Tax=Gilbertella persicaria TaxID=101096 RepID=UPI00221EB5C4|nr:uncharacterized protein B0P05DRAFT_548044 [Gilbertella persicaria]KAI8074301.1 hypothetical protein B0P05DRAFT_548044 [Gilbertella persicaria]